MTVWQVVLDHSILKLFPKEGGKRPYGEKHGVTDEHVIAPTVVTLSQGICSFTISILQLKGQFLVSEYHDTWMPVPFLHPYRQRFNLNPCPNSSCVAFMKYNTLVIRLRGWIRGIFTHKA